MIIFQINFEIANETFHFRFFAKKLLKILRLSIKNHAITILENDMHELTSFMSNKFLVKLFIWE